MAKKKTIKRKKYNWKHILIAWGMLLCFAAGVAAVRMTDDQRDRNTVTLYKLKDCSDGTIKIKKVYDDTGIEYQVGDFLIDYIANVNFTYSAQSKFVVLERKKTKDADFFK